MTRQSEWRPPLDEATRLSWEDASRRLISLEIKGLFGLYDYTIPLDQPDSRIVFLHGPNGVGKSTILRMIKAYADGDLLQLMAVPFDHVALNFSDKTAVTLQQPNKPGRGQAADATIAVRTADGQRHTAALEVRRSQHAPDSRRLGGNPTEDELGWLWLRNQFAHQAPVMEPANQKQLERYLTALDPDWRSARLWGGSPPGQQLVAPKTRVELIEADRLLALSEGKLVERVQLQLDDLTNRVGRAQEDFSQAARSLDRTYKSQLIEQPDHHWQTHTWVLNRLTTLYELQKRMLSLGLAREIDLLEPEHLMEVAKKLPASSWKLAALDLSIRESLDLYVSLEHIAVRLEALRDLVNSFYQDKQMRYEYGGAVQFVQLAGRGAIVPPTSLSSGEKHIFTLLYRLVFDTEPGAQVLIDEPELSLHISWQRRFAGALERIGEIQDLHYVLATHSPQIVGGRTESMVELANSSDADDGDE